MDHSTDDNDDSDFKTVNEVNFQRTQNKITKISYSDGIEEGRKQVFQASFDRGYEDGFRTGFELAKMRSFYEVIDNTKAKISNTELNKESVSYKELHLDAETDKSHFQYLKNPNESLTKVSDKQKSYIDGIMSNCATLLPVTTSIFAPKEG